MIRFACPACQQTLNAPEERAGARTACPRCKQPVQVPLPPAPAAPAVAALAPASSNTPVVLAPAPSADTTARSPFRRWLGIIGREIAALARATFAHLANLVALVLGLWRRRRSSRAVTNSRLALGQGLCQASLGDSQLRERIAALESNPAKPARKQRQDLLLQLAEPVLAQPSAPAAVEPQWRQARADQDACAEQQQYVQGKRAALAPQGKAGWLRVAAGYGAIAFAAFLVVSFFGKGSSTVQEVVFSAKEAEVPGFVRVTRGVSAEAPTGKPILVLDPAGHSARVSRVLFTADGQRAITVSSDKSIRVWDLVTGESLRTYRLPTGPGEEGSLHAAALSPDGKRLAVAGLPYGRGKFGVPVLVLSLETEQIVQVFKGHDNVIHTLAYSPDGKRLASGSSDRTIRIFNTSSGAQEMVLQGSGADLRDVAFSPDSRRLVSSTRDGTGHIWSLAAAKQEATLDNGGHSIISIAWSPDGQTIASGNLDGTIALYHADGKLRRLLTGIRNQVTSVRFTPDSKELLFTGVGYGAGNEAEFGASLVDLASGRERIRGLFHNNTVMHGSVSPDGSLLATTGGDDNPTYIWRRSNGQVVQTLVGQGKSVWAVGWSGDGQSIAWGNTNRGTPLEQTFHLQDLDFADAPGPGFRRAQHVRGNRVLAQGRDFRMGILEGNRLLHEFQAPQGVGERVYCYTWLADGRVVVGTAYGLYLLDPATNKILRQFAGHSGITLSVAPSPDGRHFVTGATDQTISIWDPDRDDSLLSLFFVDRDWIAWTPEGYYAASPNGERLMGWQLNQGPEALASYHLAAQFRKSLYQPDVIRHMVRAGNLRTALAQAGKPAGDLTSVAEVLPPVVSITAPAGLGTVAVPQTKFEVRANARSMGKHPVTALRLLVDGRPYKGPGGLRTIPQPQLGEVQAGWSVELSPGVHHLAVLAESRVSGSLSSALEVSVAGSSADPLPNLYVLAVGINDYPGRMRLNFAAPDADAIAKAFQGQQGRAFRKVEVRLIKDRQATRAGILQGLDWLGSVMTPRDVGLISFSGHGDRDPQGNFYLVPVDVNVNNIAASCVPGDLLKKKLADLPGRLIAVLDACHSGTAAEGAAPARGRADDLVRDLIGEEYGVIVMSSSLGREVSLESPAVKHGFFTLALVEGLAGQADGNRDGTVFLNELDRYAARRVRQLSDGEQNPVTARPLAIRSFALSRP